MNFMFSAANIIQDRIKYSIIRLMIYEFMFIFKGSKTLIQSFVDFCQPVQSNPNVIRDYAMDTLVYGFLRKIDHSLPHKFDVGAVRWFQTFNCKFLRGIFCIIRYILLLKVSQIVKVYKTTVSS